MSYKSGSEWEQAELDREWWDDHIYNNYTGQFAVIIVIVAMIAVMLEIFRNR